MAGEFYDWLRDHGRLGGAGCLVLAAVVAAFIVIDYRTTGGFFVAMPGLVLILVLLGVGLIIKGGTSEQLDIDGREPPPPELVRQLHAHEKPFFVCTRCRRIAEGGMCDKCGTQADCLEIEDEDDIQMALSAMS
jgi:hypothetical protein